MHFSSRPYTLHVPAVSYLVALVIRMFGEKNRDLFLVDVFSINRRTCQLDAALLYVLSYRL